MLKRIWLVLFIGLSFAQTAVAAESARVPAGALRCMGVTSGVNKAERVVENQRPVVAATATAGAQSAR